MSGSAKVEEGNDVYLEEVGSTPYATDAHITVTDSLGNTPAAWLTPGEYNTGLIVVWGSSGHTLTDEDKKKFPITSQNWTTERDGNTLKLKMKTP